MIDVNIGTTEINEIIYENIESVGNLLIYGGSGSGKSNWIKHTLQNIVKTSPQDLFKICYINPWGKEFLPVDKKFLFNEKTVAETTAESDSLFDEILIEIERRTKNKVNSPKIIIICDDIDGNLINLQKLEEILKLGCKNGVYTVLSSQLVDWLPNEIIGCFKSKLLFWHYNTENINKLGIKVNLGDIKPFSYYYQNGNDTPIKCKPLNTN